MRRIMVFAVAVAAFISVTVDVSAQAPSDPGHSNGHSQLVRDPSGQLVNVVRRTHTPGQQKAQKAPAPAANLATGTGTGCSFFATNQY